MTPVLTAHTVRVKSTAAVEKYPLANRAGITLFTHLIEADRVWRSCTPPQKTLLAELCPPVVRLLLERGELHAEDMPTLPGRVTAASRRAMAHRGLVDEHGRLTAAAVHAWFYTVRTKDGDA